MTGFGTWTLSSVLLKARADSERARWRVFRAMPHLLTAEGRDGLAPEVELTIMAHNLLDDGLDFCPPCDTLVRAGRFCGRCGSSLVGAAPEVGRPVRRCPDERCGHDTRSTWCESCGARVVPLDIERIERGDLNVTELVRQTMAQYRAWQAAHPEPPPESDSAHERRRLYNMSTPE